MQHDKKSAHPSPAPQQPQSEAQAGEEWAEEWHRVVELTLRMMGLSSAMGAAEALAAIHEYFVKIEEPFAHPPAQPQSEKMRTALRAIATLRQHSREDDADNAVTMQDLARAALAAQQEGGEA